MQIKNSFIYALRHSLPILVGFVPVGLAYGVLMQNAGYNALWTGSTSVIVLAGSLQFLMVSFFTGTASYLTVAVMALLLNSRHIFYGISFIEKWRQFGGWKYFLIYSLADENYSLHCSAKVDETMDEKWVSVFTAALVASYWLVLSIIGALIGSLLPFDMAGVDFAMTALFVVILLDQLKDAPKALPALLGAVSSVICLLVFGADRFILPSLVITVAALILLRKTAEAEKEAA